MIPVRSRLLAAAFSPCALAATAWTGGHLGWWPQWLPGPAWAAAACLASVPVALLAWALWPRSGPGLPPDPEEVRKALQHAERTAAAAVQVVELARAMVQVHALPAAAAPGKGGQDQQGKQET